MSLNHSCEAFFSELALLVLISIFSQFVSHWRLSRWWLQWLLFDQAAAAKISIWSVFSRFALTLKWWYRTDNFTILVIVITIPPHSHHHYIHHPCHCNGIWTKPIDHSNVLKNWPSLWSIHIIKSAVLYSVQTLDSPSWCQICSLPNLSPSQILLLIIIIDNNYFVEKFSFVAICTPFEYASQVPQLPWMSSSKWFGQAICNNPSCLFEASHFVN